ncbi:MAG: kinase [Gammaproteobacteria bacterium]|nr:kinase [Gammaproteobacteria bacterium]
MSLTIDELNDTLGRGAGPELATQIAARLDPAAPADWRNLAAVLAARGRVGVTGISGAQGSGKSTLAQLLVAADELAGASAAGCSLDDFYLTHEERGALGRTVHPLLATRGVPGTHDVRLAMGTLDGLARAQTTRIPVFDKGRDDRLPVDAWEAVTGPVSRVVFEGWCLGATPQPAESLTTPINQLEAGEDADGSWRRYVNGALAERYLALWERVDYLVYLQVPDFAAVARWRGQAEGQLPLARQMDRAALSRFLAHYERLTRWMLETLPQRADLVVKLDPDHTLASISAD